MTELPAHPVASIVAEGNQWRLRCPLCALDMHVGRPGLAREFARSHHVPANEIERVLGTGGGS